MGRGQRHKFINLRLLGGRRRKFTKEKPGLQIGFGVAYSRLLVFAYAFNSIECEFKDRLLLGVNRHRTGVAGYEGLTPYNSRPSYPFLEKSVIFAW